MIDKFRNYLGNKFRNYVFRNRLGKNIWTARLIGFVMSILDKNQIYINTGDVDNFDHYVPKLLLNRWRISETGTNKGKIFFWSKAKRIIDKENIKEAAGEINWDTSMAQGKPSDYVSKKIYAELLEQKSNYIIKYINDNKNPKLTFPEESTLSSFVSHQITRVPYFKEQLKKFFSLAYSKKLISEEDLGDKKILMDKVLNNNINITYDQFNKAHIILDGTKQQESWLSLVIADNIAEKIYKTNYLKFLEISEKDENQFVISDNPVVLLDMERNKILNCMPWWEIGIKKFIILMPISPKKAILYTPINDDSNLPVKEFIELLNFGQYTNCSEGVFSKREETIKKHLRYYNL